MSLFRITFHGVRLDPARPKGGFATLDTIGWRPWREGDGLLISIEANWKCLALNLLFCVVFQIRLIRNTSVLLRVLVRKLVSGNT